MDLMILLHKTLNNSASDTVIDNLTEAQVDSILLAGLIASVLSLIGCIFNLITTIVLKITTHTLGKMVICLSLMDIFVNFSGILESVRTDSDIYCGSITFLSAFGYGGSLTWTCCFAHLLYVTVNKDIGNRSADAYFKIYNGVSGAIAVTIAFIAVIFQLNTVQEHLCWSRSDDNLGWVLVSLRTAPVSIALIYCIGCYLVIIRKLKTFQEDLHLELLLYPLVLVICYLPFALMRMSIQFFNADVPFSLEILSVILYDSQGLLNALAYGLSKRIFTKSGGRQCLHSVNCCWGRRRKRRAEHFDSTSSDSVLAAELLGSIKNESEIEPPKYL